MLLGLVNSFLAFGAKPPHPKGGPPGTGGGTVGIGAPTSPINDYLWLLAVAAIFLIIWIYYRRRHTQKI